MKLNISLTSSYLFLWSLCLVNASRLAIAPSAMTTLYTTELLNGISDQLLAMFSPFDFWNEAQNLGQKATDYVNNELQLQVLRDGSIATKVEELKYTIRQAVKAVHELSFTGTGSLIEKRSVNLEEVFKHLDVDVDWIIEQVMLEFSEPLPENRTERYKKREVAMDKGLDMMEEAVVRAYQFTDVSEDEVREKFGEAKPHIRSVVLIMGDLADNHPYIVDTIIFSVAIMILPEGFILRPLVRLFGISPLGAVKGSPAAWCQRFFFGATVPKGSWFAKLLQAGMKFPGGLLGRILRYLLG